MRSHAPGRRGRLLPSLASSFLILAGACGDGGTGPDATLVSIAITPGLPVIEPGSMQQFNATGTYDDGATSDVTGSALWASNNVAALTVGNESGSKGLAERITDGSARVTAAIGGINASVDVQVWCTVLASSQLFDGDLGGTGTGFGIGRLAQDEGSVYWAGFDASAGATGGYIGSVRKPDPLDENEARGTDVTMASPLVMGLGGINDLVSDGAHVYWTEFDIAEGTGAVKRVPVTGGAVETLASGTPPGSSLSVFFPEGIALDPDNVYWGQEAPSPVVRRVPKAGGEVADFTGGEGFGPTALALDATQVSGATHVYGVANAGGVAGRIALAGGTYQELASGLGNPEGLTLDAQSLYWSELVGEPNGRIAKVALAGGAVTELATGLDNPKGVAVRDGTVYYAAAAGAGSERRSGIWSVPAAGGTPRIHAGLCGTASGGGFDGLVADADDLFFVELGSGGSGPGRVLRAPRE